MHSRLYLIYVFINTFIFKLRQIFILHIVCILVSQIRIIILKYTQIKYYNFCKTQNNIYIIHSWIFLCYILLPRAKTVRRSPHDHLLKSLWVFNWCGYLCIIFSDIWYTLTLENLRRFKLLQMLSSHWDYDLKVMRISDSNNYLYGYYVYVNWS